MIGWNGKRVEWEKMWIKRGEKEIGRKGERERERNWLTTIREERRGLVVYLPEGFERFKILWDASGISSMLYIHFGILQDTPGFSATFIPGFQCWLREIIAAEIKAKSEVIPLWRLNRNLWDSWEILWITANKNYESLWQWLMVKSQDSLWDSLEFYYNIIWAI